MPDTSQQQQQQEPSGVQRINIPVAGGAMSQFSLNMDCQTLINMYPVQDDKGKYPSALFPTPGLTVFATLPGVKCVRGLFEVAGNLVAVGDNTFYRIDSSGNVSAKGGISSLTGTPTFCANSQGGEPTQLMVSDDNYGYVYQTATDTLAQITDPNFLGSSFIDFLNGYANCVVPQANLWQVSAADTFLDGTTEVPTWDATQIASTSAWASSPNIQAIISHQLKLYVFTDKGAELWIPASGSQFPWQRRTDTLLTQGTCAPHSIVRANNSMYWLTQTESGRGFLVYDFYDYTQKKISTEGVETAIQGYKTVSDCIGYTIAWKGHLWYVWTFPTANATWVFDEGNSLWFQMQSLDSNGNPGRHLGNCHSFCYGKNLVGDYQSGNIYYLDDTSFTDNGALSLRERTMQHLFHQNRLVTIWNLELNVEAGVGLENGQGSTPQVTLEISRDGGNTWGNVKFSSIGKTGKRLYRVKWLRLGQSRDWVFRFRCSDPVKFVILGATADIELGDD